MKRLLILFGLLFLSGFCLAEDDTQDEDIALDHDIGSEKEGSRTDENVVDREAEAIQLDGLNVAQMKELRDKAEKHAYQAEISRMMKLIINSLYRNKEIFLRELISNASDALDKIRLLSLTDRSVLDATEEFSIRIKADKENHMLHITDTGIGMTKQDLITNLGTIAKSGTTDFFNKMQDTASTETMSDLIGQFGVGFYSSFLVADKVVVTSKHNDDKQYIWESDAADFSTVEDPRGDSLKRGTTVSLHLKEEAFDFLEHDTLSNLIKKYSQFINFNIYLWGSKTEEVEEPLEEGEQEEIPKEEVAETEDEEGKVEEEKEDKPKTKKVQKTTWDWTLINDSKPIWTRKPADIVDDEYNEFYKKISKDQEDPLAKVHFIAEGEVTFRSLLYVPSQLPGDTFQNYGAKTDYIKLYVRRVFITDDFADMMPKYLSFIRGVVDSDDLPLNVSRETLQQHKLLKVIKKKLVRKALDMIKKINASDYEKFWKEYSTNIKLGVIEDSANRTRLARLMRFLSSQDNTKLTSLAEYVERMKEGQEHIYYIAGQNMDEVKNSPFVERLISKGYEVLYLTEAVDEYAISAIPEFDGKKFQNVAKEGVSIDKGDKAKDKLESLRKSYEPLTKWLQEDILKDQILKAEVGERLANTPCALISSQFGWTGNMQRIISSQTHSKTGDMQRDYYMNQKKTMEINPRHPLIKELLKRVEDNPADPEAKEAATMLFRTATLRSGYQLKDDLVSFAQSIELLMRKNMGIPDEEKLDEEEEEEETGDKEGEEEDQTAEEHDEL